MTTKERLSDLPALLGIGASMALALCGCGGQFGALGFHGEDHSNEVHFREYVYADGTHADDQHLALTYGPLDNPDVGYPGFNVLMNDVLIGDDDPWRARNVAIHEFGNVIVLDHGMPDNVTPYWFLWDGDVKGDADMDPDEAEWFSQYGGYEVHIHEEWMEAPVLNAVSYVNTYAMREVFTAPAFTAAPSPFPGGGK